MARGRRPNLDLPVTPSLNAQRAFRERKRKHVSDLEAQVQRLTQENEEVKRQLASASNTPTSSSYAASLPPSNSGFLSRFNSSAPSSRATVDAGVQTQPQSQPACSTCEKWSGLYEEASATLHRLRMQLSGLAKDQVSHSPYTSEHRPSQSFDTQVSFLRFSNASNSPQDTDFDAARRRSHTASAHDWYPPAPGPSPSNTRLVNPSQAAQIATDANGSSYPYLSRENVLAPSYGSIGPARSSYGHASSTSPQASGNAINTEHRTPSFSSVHRRSLPSINEAGFGNAASFDRQVESSTTATHGHSNMSFNNSNGASGLTSTGYAAAGLQHLAHSNTPPLALNARIKSETVEQDYQRRAGPMDWSADQGQHSVDPTSSDRSTVGNTHELASTTSRFSNTGSYNSAAAAASDARSTFFGQPAENASAPSRNPSRSCPKICIPDLVEGGCTDLDGRPMKCDDESLTPSPALTEPTSSSSTSASQRQMPAGDLHIEIDPNKCCYGLAKCDANGQIIQIMT